MYLSGAGIADIDRHGASVEDDDFLVLFNAGQDDVAFTIHALEGDPWQPLIDTAYASGVAPARRCAAGQSYQLRGRSLALLTRGLTAP
jgi:glycogen operon protein